MTICTPWTVVSRSVLMSVIITFMFEPAKLQMNWASASGTSTRPQGHRRLSHATGLRHNAPYRSPGDGLSGLVNRQRARDRPRSGATTMRPRRRSP